MAYGDSIWTIKKPTAQSALPLPEPVVRTSTKSAYQQNLYQPMTEAQGRTTRDVLAKISEIYQYDPDKANTYLAKLQSAQQNPNSKYYNPFTVPTNKAVSNLAAYGFDLNNLNDGWLDQNRGWINSNLLYNGTTNTPSKPGKKATQDQRIAYELYQYQMSEADTKKAEQQWAALQEELTYWTQRKDKNYSDEQVLKKIDWSKYGALVKMDDSRKNYKPVELNRAIDYSEDALYGVIWKARNPEYTGGLLGAMAYSASGAGNTWKEDPEITARLDASNSDTYAPYTVGSTMDDACLYYGRDSFDADWVKTHRPDGSDATEAKMWNAVEEAERFTSGAEAELAEFNSWLDRRLQSAEDPADVMKAVDSRLGMSKYKSLKTLNDSLNKVDALVNTTRAIDFSYNDIKRKVEETCAKNAGKLDGQQTLEQNGVDAGSEQARQSTKVSDKTVKNAALMLDGALTEYEQLVLDNTPSFLYGIVKQALAAVNPLNLLARNEASTTKDYTTSMITLSADIAANQDAKTQLDNLYRVNAELVDKLRGLQVDGGYLAMMDPAVISNAYKEVTGADLGDGPDALRKAGSMMQIIMDTPEGETPWVLNQFLGKKQELETQIEKTKSAQAEYDKQQQAWNARIELYDRLGLDSTPLRAAEAVSTAMASFSDYEASKWGSYNAYQLMEQGMAGGATFDQVLQAAQAGHEKTQEALENARWLKEYITENGIGTETMQMSLGPAGISATANLGLPAKYVQNLDRFIEKLERSEEDYKYFALRGEKDFEELAEKGKAIEAQLNLPPDARLEGAGENGVGFSTFMTDEEKQTYYYLMAKYGSEDPMKGREEAMRYWSHLADPEYGVVSSRGTEAVKAFAGKMVQDSPVIANAMAALAAPMEGFMGALNFGLNAIMGWESNPDSSLLGPGYFSQTVNEKTAERIRQEVPEGPLQDLALGGYEIIYNRARSFVNAMATGGLSIGGRFGAILTELAGAVPMATGAAAMATADAKRKGADDTTACAIGAVTFMMEDFTEGLTRSNIREAIHGGEDTIFNTVKDRVMHWLTSSGLEEAFGETLTDYVENLVDKEWMGARSEHAELVNQYIQELGLDPNNPVDVDRAEQLALQDEAAGLVRTAVISFLSPGTDVLTGTISDQIRDYHNIKTTAQNLQAQGADVSLSDVRKAYKDWKVNGPRVQTEVAEEEGYDRSFADTIGQLDAVEGSDETTQAAALSDVFSREENTPAADTADAAASAITNVFGTMGSAVKQVRNIMTFAHVTQREELVRRALQTGALSPASVAAQTLVSPEFANAQTLEEQVNMLADTVEQDAQNETVTREISSAVREYRIAAAEKDIIGNGALESVKPLQEAAEKAQAAITDAQNDYDSRADEVTAKSDAVKAAQETFVAEPTADNQHALDRTLGELEKADAVKQEYEQRLENAKAANEDAQAKFETARDTAMQNIRQQAEQAVAEQDQQRAEAEKQAMIQAELDRTLREEQRTEANYARAQADEIIEEHYANASEEEKEKIRGIVSNLRQAQQTAVDKVLEHKNYVERIAKKYNVKINIGDTTQGGRFLYQNASVNPKTGEIILSEQATVSDAMYAILVHELTHIAEGSEELYNEMADALLKLEYGDNVDQMNADIAAREDLYRNALTKLREQGANVNPDDVTPEYARQEIVADLMGKLLSGDDELLNRFAQESPSIARRIVEAIKSFLKKMVGIQEAPLSEAQIIVDKLEAALKDTEAQRANAEPAVAKPMVENSAGQPLVSELPGGTAVLDPAAKFSLNSFNPDEQKKVRDALISSKRFTRAQVDRYMGDALGIASLIAADKQRLDFEASDNQVFLKPNNDYYFTLDASTLCAKRLLYQGTFDYVQHALPDEVFTPEDLIDLVNIMADMGYETPCGICYVESRRRWLDTYAQKFLDELPAEADGFIEKYFSKAEEEDKAAIREHYADWHPTIDDLTTSDGLEQLRHDNPYMHKAFVDAMNKKGTANPKVVQLRTEYRGDIRNLTPKDIQKVKDIGGLRIQSFSDFETPHLLDMMQAVLDMSAVGLTSQAYTKVPNFAWVFGDTGIKINLSLIGKGTGLDENGNLVFDNREGINFDEAMKLRERYGKNVGTILVGINDDHIIAAMGDPRIDFIIPFHKSGWSAEELRKMPTLHNYEDYTDTQNERLIIGRNKDGSYETESFKKHKDRTKESLENFQPVGKNGYWNFSKSGQWNAEKYLKMCAKAKRVPKFSQFLVDNGDGSFSLPQGTDKRSTSIREGYWKTLIDFKMYENDCYGRTREDGTKTEVKGSKQQEVKPNINMAEAYRVMDEYKLGRQMPDNPDGTPGKFIPMESNNSVPVATPAGDRYIELIKAKRAGIKPAGPNPDTLEADLPADAQYANPRASAFGAAQAPAVLGNTESTENADEDYSAQQDAMAIDAETGEAVRTRFSLPVTNEDTLSFLNKQEENGEVTTTYRTMKLLDGKLVSPKASFINGKIEGDTQLGQWEEATEHPELIKFDANGKPYFELEEKGRKTKARYNPYMHSSNLMLNDQFAGAYQYSGDDSTLGKFVTVECLVPNSEAESGYQAQYAKDPVGWTNWKAGGVAQQIEKAGGEKRNVFLSRWIKPVRIVPDSEVAQHYKKLLGDTGIEIPANVVTPGLLEELKKAGVQIGPPQKQQENSYYKTTNTRYSLPSDAPYLSAVNHGDMEEAQRLVDERAEEAGYTLVGYHGTKMPTLRYDTEGFGDETDYENKRLPFTIFRAGQSGGIYMASNRDVSEGFAQRFDKQPGTVMSLYVKFDNPLVVNEHVYTSVPRYYNIPTPSVMKEAGYTQETLSTEEISQFAQENGYDGVIIEGIREGTDTQTDDFIAFRPDQIKLADPVTYDDDGNVIPLSERFNTESEDIRYSLPSDNILTDQIRYYMEGNGLQETITLRTDTVEEPRQRQWGRKGAQASDELAEIIKRHVYQNNLYTPTTNAKQLDRAIEWIRSNRAEGDEDGYYTSVQKIKNNSYNYRSADGQARMVAVMGLAVAKNDTSTQADLADIFNRQGTSIGQALQARKLWLLMTPEGREQSLNNMLTRTQNDLNAKGTDIDLKLSDWIYMAARASEDEADLQKVYQAAAVELAEQLPQNWRDKFRSWRMLSMLGNPRTHIRNVLGNAFFVPVVGLKNKLGAIAELGMSEKTKTLKPWLSKAVRDFARQDAINMKDELTGEAKYNEDNRVQREQKAFKGLLQAVIDFNSDALEKEDWMFLKGHYRRALGGWIEANGYTVEQLQNDPELLNAGRTYAINEAQKATYRDFNKLAATLNKVSREGGVSGFLVDAALPFKKTPANILRRGMEYSPVGIMRSLTTDIYHLKQWYDAQNGKLNEIPEKALSPTQFIDRLCSGLAGSAVLAAGFLLGGMGVVSCGLDDDDDKIEKAEGGQEYAVNFGKLVNKIFNAKILSEDVTFTMDWAAPMSMPFFVGAAIYEQLANGGDFNAEEVINAFGNITEPVFNLSMLDGVNSLFKTSQYDDTNTITQIGAKIVSNYATSYVPSLLGAVARTADDTRRKAFVKSGEGTGILGTFRYAMEQTENKIPGLSQTNIPYRDVWGNPETSGLAERIVENFIAPGYISQYKDDPVLNELDRLYQIKGDSSLIPKDPDKSVSYKNQKYVLSAEQWDTYKAERGRAAFSALNDLIRTEDYQNASADVQVQMVKNAWSFANKVGMAAIIPDYDTTAINTTTATSIAADTKIDGYKADMIKALNAGDFTAYETMVEALHEAEIEDSEIKAKIRDTYREQYKTAYRTGNNQRMAEIEDLLDETGYDFSDLISGWEDQVDENR